MKRVFYLTLIMFIMFAAIACNRQNGTRVTVSNPSDYDRLTELIEISVDSILARENGQVTVLDTISMLIVKNAAGEEIPSQVTYDRKLIFQPSLKAGDKKQFYIDRGVLQKYEPRVWGRLMPERYDDFAWENDRVAFRIYGEKLIAKDGASNGIDIWYKYTDKFIMEPKIAAYLAGENAYHDDNGDGGLDDYNVGHSLGAGAAAPYIDEKLILNENFVDYKVLDSGALRITFSLAYKNLDVNGTNSGEMRVISLDAGSQLSKITQKYESQVPFQVVAGIVRVAGDTVPLVDLEKGYMIYQQPKTPKVEGVYLGVLIPDGIEKVVPDTYTWYNPVKKAESEFSHWLAVPTEPLVTYYTGYGWSRYGFPTVADFETYMKNFAQGLKEPLIVKY